MVQESSHEKVAILVNGRRQSSQLNTCRGNIISHDLNLWFRSTHATNMQWKFKKYHMPVVSMN